MNKKARLISLILVAAIAAGMVFLLTGNSGKDAKEEMMPNTSVQTTTQTPVQAKPVTVQPGSYIDYRDNVLADTSGTKLLFFHAPWCPQCRDLEADIRKNGVPDGITVIKVDYDSSQQLRKQYGVTLQTTIVKVGDNGALVKKFVAYDEPNLSAVLRNL